MIALCVVCTEMHKLQDGMSFLLQREKAEREQMQEEMKGMRSAAKELNKLLPADTQGV